MDLTRLLVLPGVLVAMVGACGPENGRASEPHAAADAPGANALPEPGPPGAVPVDLSDFCVPPRNGGEDVDERRATAVTPPARVHHSAISRFEEGLRCVIRTREEWDAIRGRLIFSGEPPEIDFSSESILLAALGPRSTTGSGIGIDTLVTSTDSLVAVVFSYESASPVEGTEETSPVDAVRVPRVAGPVRFVERTGRGITGRIRN